MRSALGTLNLRLMTSRGRMSRSHVSTQNFRRLDLAFQQSVYQRAHVLAPLLRGFCQPRLHFGVEINWKVEFCTGTVKPATFCFGEVVFFFHVQFWRYWRASVLVALRAEMIRQLAVPSPCSRQV